MSFLSPIIGAVGSSLLGGLFKQGPTAAESGVLKNDATAQQTGLSAGQNLIGMGTGAVQQPLNYWSSILSGNKSLMTSALAPEVQQIGAGYNQAAKTSTALNPRGGASITANAAQPWNQQRDVSTLFQQARPAAATASAGLGQSLLSTGANSLYASTAAGRDILNQQEALRKANINQGKSIGGGLFSMFQQYGQQPLSDALGKIFGRGGSNTTATTGGPATIYS